MGQKGETQVSQTSNLRIKACRARTKRKLTENLRVVTERDRKTGRELDNNIGVRGKA